MGIGIGLAGTGIQLWFPDQRGLGKWLTIFGVVVVAVAVIAYVVRWLTIREYEREHARSLSSSPVPVQVLNQAANLRNEFNARNENVFSPSLHLSMPEQKNPIDESRRVYAQPHIEFTNPEIVDRWLDEHGRLMKELSMNRGGSPFSIMLARFYYKPDLDVPPSMKVKAQISIADSEGKPIKARYDAVWDGKHDSEYAYFETAQTRPVIVALLPVETEVDGIMTWGFGRNKTSQDFAADRVTLQGKEFRVRIEVIGKYEGAIVLQVPLDFRLRVHPPSFELV